MKRLIYQAFYIVYIKPHKRFDGEQSSSGDLSLHKQTVECTSPEKSTIIKPVVGLSEWIYLEIDKKICNLNCGRGNSWLQPSNSQTLPSQAPLTLPIQYPYKFWLFVLAQKEKQKEKKAVHQKIKKNNTKNSSNILERTVNNDKNDIWIKNLYILRFSFSFHSDCLFVKILIITNVLYELSGKNN